MCVKVVVCLGAEEYEHELADDIQSPPGRLPGTTANSPDKEQETARHNYSFSERQPLCLNGGECRT